MTESSLTSPKEKRFNPTTIVLLFLPLVALAGVILLFLKTGDGLTLATPAPVEALSIERTVLKPGKIEIYVRNASPEDLTIAQAVINDAAWPFTISPAATIPRLQNAWITFDYHWSYGEAYFVRLFTSNAIPFDLEIPVAFESPQADSSTFLMFTLIGLYVGVIPVYLGLFWFPALRQFGRKSMVFLLAITAGLLVFLGLETVAEAVEQAGQVAGPFQGIGLVGIGAVGTFFLLDAISKRQVSIGRSETSQRLALATMIAVGIGLHNLGEGLAIGAAYSIGEIALGGIKFVCETFARLDHAGSARYTIHFSRVDAMKVQRVGVAGTIS